MLTLRYLRRGLTVALIGLSLVVGMLMHLALSLGLSYAPAMNAKADELHAPDALMVAHKLPRDFSFDGHGLTEVEVSNAQALFGEIQHGDETIVAFATFFDRDEAPLFNQFRDIEALDTSVTDPVWAPLILSSHYKLGDPLTVTVGDTKHTFHIQGFVENFYGGATGAGGLFFQVPHGTTITDAAPVSVVKANGQTVTEAGKGVAAALGDHHVEWGQVRDLMLSIATVGSSVFAVVFAAFAALMSAAMLIVVWFLLSNLVRRDLPAIGALRAIGYTTRQVLTAFTAAFALASLTGAAIGVALSHVLLPVVADVLTSQSGLIWEPQWSTTAVLGAVLPITLVIAGIAALRGARLTRISTLDALHGEADAKDSSVGLPLSSSGGPLNVKLGIKTLLSQPGQQFALLVTVLMLTFATSFVFAISTGLLGDADKAKLLLVGELEDIQVFMEDSHQMNDVLTAVRAVDGVQTAFRGSADGRHINERASVIVSADDPSVWRTDVIVEGRLPKHANEVALGAPLADRAGVGVGDTFHLDTGRHEADFVVTGIASSARAMGQVAMMTTAGEKHLNPKFEPHTVMVYVAHGHAIDDVVSTIEKDLARYDVKAANVQEAVSAELASFTTMGSMLAMVISLVSGIIISLVLALITTTLIASNTKRFGIFKAVGFTTGQVTRQVVWTYLPTLALGAAAAAVIGHFATTPLLITLLRGVGIISVRIPMPAWIPVVVSAAVVGLGLLVVWLSALRLRKVTPTVLLAN